MKHLLLGCLFGLSFRTALAATCTFSGSWDATPATGDDIVITSGTLTWDTTLPAKVASWTQSGGTVTIGTTFDDTFPYLEVTGDISLTGGTWTHKENSKAKLSSTANKFRLYVKCGGNMTIGSAAIITGDALGYTSVQSVNGHTNSGNQGGSYGGHGSFSTQVVNGENWTYGSLFAPEELGNKGCTWTTYIYGGGAVRLDVTGALSHAGKISVDGQMASQAYYSGSGGSIYIHAGSISGAGTLTADSPATQYGGSGGRIAVILTGDGADFSNFDIYSQASAIQKRTSSDVAGCGTIYAETKADGDQNGWLILKGNGTEPTMYKLCYADPFSYEMTSAHFSKITIAGKTKFALREGYTLDITDTVIDLRESDSTYAFYLCGGTLTSDKPLSVDYTIDCRTVSTIDIADLTIASGGVLKGVDTITLPGNLTVANGGKMTTDGASDTPTHRLDISVGGNLTVAEGGIIDVTGCGYSIPKGPYGSVTDNSGGSHGGWGITSGSAENSAMPYGSITDPLTAGHGGCHNANTANSSKGGGVVRLQVTGALTVNGSILANGAAGTHYMGAGGSINITAGSIAESEGGIIEASGGKASQQTAAAAGGRVAIKLTGAGDFSACQGTIGAYSYGNSNGSKYGGAGTVYLQTAAQGENGGALIIDNGSAKKTQGSTLVGGTVGGTMFGDVIIRNNGKLKLADNATLTVKGNFQNEATFAAGAGSTVVFAGTGVSVVSGNSTFVNLGCTTAGKSIKFAAGSTQTVTGAMTMSSEGDLITLCADEDSGTWNLDTSAGAAILSGVAIGGCQSTSAISVTDGEDLGGNSANVTVMGSVEPATITWSGAVDGSWANAGNWDLRVPTKVDTVIIPANTPTATLAANAKVAALTVAGTLDVADKGIEVAGDMTVSGAFVASGAAPIVVGGNLTGSGTFTAASSTVTLNGASAPTVSCADSFAFNSLVVLSPCAAFSGKLTCASLTLGAGTFTFADKMTVSTTSFTVNGTSASDVTLKCATDGGTWYLKTSISSVVGATVSGSDASGGVAIAPTASQDAGNNVNWLFNDTRLRWTGAVDTDFATPGNWKGGVAPTATDAVVIEGDYEVVIADATTVAGLTLGIGATVRVNAATTVNGSVVVEPQGTLVGNRPMAISGNLSVVDGGVLTHDENDGVEANKVDLTVGGTAYFSENATISVQGKGYVYHESSVYRGPGNCAPYKDTWAAASHGGRGWYNATLVSAMTNGYGSIVNPVNVGTAGGWAGNGGGAFILKVAGTLTLDAELTADAASIEDLSLNKSYYSGSGGTVNIRAGTLIGKGAITACGGNLKNTMSGAGGRIAIVLTEPNATFAAFTGTIAAYGGAANSVVCGSAGTVYKKLASETAGVLVIDNGTVDASTALHIAQDKTDFPKTQDNDPAETKGIDVVVRSGGTLNLTADADIASLEVAATARVLLNGYTLRVHSRKPKDKTLFDDTRVDASAGGAIVWSNPGLMLIVR